MNGIGKHAVFLCWDGSICCMYQTGWTHYHANQFPNYAFSARCMKK
jgi:hypothetical protein